MVVVAGKGVEMHPDLKVVIHLHFFWNKRFSYVLL